MIQIQNGKYYRTRNGSFVGPVSVDPTQPLWKVRDQYNDVWTEHGHFLRPGLPHGRDLIEEVTADPDFFTQAIQRIDKLEAAIDRMQEAVNRLKDTVTNINPTNQ